MVDLIATRRVLGAVVAATTAAAVGVAAAPQILCFYPGESGGGAGGSSYVEPAAIKPRMWTGWEKAKGDGRVYLRLELQLLVLIRLAPEGMAIAGRITGFGVIKLAGGWNPALVKDGLQQRFLSSLPLAVSYA